MVFNLTFVFDDDSLNTSPGSPPAFLPSPSVASPPACNGCIGVISRFDELQLRGRLEGAAEEMRDEDSGGRNGLAGKANRIAKKQVKEVSLLVKAVKVLDAIGASMTNLNMNNSFMSRRAANEKIIEVLAFEVGNTITKGANLMQSLVEQNIVSLKVEVLPSEGVQYLVSTDMDELLRIAAADQRKELQLFTKEVVRLGNLCKDHQFHHLDLYFDKMESRPASGTPLRKDAWAVMLPLMNLVRPTAELYHELHALDSYEQEYQHKLQEHISLDAKDKDESLPILRSKLRSQRRHVKSLKNISLWSRALDGVVEKLVDIILCLQYEVLKAFGSADFEREAGGSASSGSKLGSSGMALHYAIIITLIDNIVTHSGSVPPTMTNALYQSLPPGIKSALRFWLRQGQIQEEPTILIIKAQMEKTLSWLAPVAANTIKAHYGFARLGEWPSMRSRVNQRCTVKDDFVRFNTLYHADKEKTDSYIVELLFWLHQLVCKRRAINNGVTCSLDSMVSSLSNEEIRLSSHSLRKDVDKRKLMPRTRETLESETEGPCSCYDHLLCTGICDSPTNRSLGVSVPILKTLSMDFGIDMMTALDVIDGITAP
ncbi:protein PSK SIMULATOR 1-like isoform X2 [Rhodamnia argentea]|uniref:Protein PSK SIMULATOR 1-like isoform X2 n=1 Tax=Rhodamnia argentea TaxID=178133 RepID=A0ABM3H1T8_9MYRT|nr:protein PSK SIMULATOR 1-like isoform X2 [Rhodamnia argentea]